MRIGAQLWLFHTVLDECEMDGILSRLGEAGYDCVETVFGKPPSSREILDRVGMACYATHFALSSKTEVGEIVDYCHRMGAKVACVSGLLEWNERTADDYRRSVEALNSLGRQLRDQGISLQYHNHDFEFDRFEDGGTMMDFLVSNFDPKEVSLCFDAGWAAKAGHDPVEFMLRHWEIIQTLHLRDFKGATSVPLGQGDLDLKATLDSLPQLPALGAVMVEQDPGTPDPVGDLIQSRKYLSSIEA